MKVTICPPAKAPKPRKTELHTICVRWKEHGNIYFQWFKREKQAEKFHLELTKAGISMWDILVVRK